MPGKVRRDISIRQDVYLQLRSHSSDLGIPLSSIIRQLCISFIENKDRQKLDHRDIKF